MVGSAFALVALAAVALYAPAASAYPPGSKLKVAVTTTSPAPGDNFTVNLTISNAPPKCPIAISVKKTVYLTVLSPAATGTDKGVTFSTPVTLPSSKDKSSTVTVNTDCAPAKKEKAKTKVSLRGSLVKAANDDNQCRKDKGCEFQARYFARRVPITFMAKFSPVPGGPTSPDIVRPGRQTDGDGNADIELKFPVEGVWTVFAMTADETRSLTVTVKKK